jgi:hypothetical protein
MRARTAVLIALAAAAAAGLFCLPPISQSAQYHAFADRREMCGVPNFWNVVSNGAFLAVAALGVGALRNRAAFSEAWERAAFGILLAGTALVAFGSGWYHLRPNNESLFWDRLPMAIVFMCLLAALIGERVSMLAGRRLLVPLLCVGAASVVYWRSTGDLRPYVVVQFYPLLAIPLMLMLFPARYTNTPATWMMAALYVLAKGLEFLDHPIARFAATGGHPWKHIAAAAALACYVASVRSPRRSRLPSAPPWPTPGSCPAHSPTSAPCP